jgi:MoaA/NifB/PqqE/SkfB family radical SAM enzyme
MKTYTTHIDAQGRLILPPDIIQQLGLTPGVKITLEENEHSFSVARPITSLKRVYVEVTNQCNLNCATCMRNVWDVEFGRMSLERFERILDGVMAFSPKPEIFLGGYGEPLTNPHCMAMVEMAKSRDLKVSLITNGTLLSEEISYQLVGLKLDMLWVSLDGASAECYADVRLGNEFPHVIDNLKMLRSARFRVWGSSPWSGYPRLGIAFVAMSRNIGDIEKVIQLGTRLGALEFSISNVLAHNQGLREENLYLRSMDQVTSRYAQQWKPLVYLPRMDIDERTEDAIIDVLRCVNQVELFGSRLNQNVDRCPFVERGSLSVRWDGKVSPCLPLLYTHTYFLDDRERLSQAYFVGDLSQRHLSEVWDDPDYLTLRDRLRSFDFSPCTYCNSCEMANDNLEDCYGNVIPTCGGCLWAQGLIRCP